MTATPDLLDNLVEDQTYQLHTSPVRPDGTGGVHWHLMRYQRVEDELVWFQVATRTTITLTPDFYRDAALGWLRSLGHDTYTMDVILILPDGVERLGA